MIGPKHLEDNLTFCVTTKASTTGILTDADAVPAYRIYEDETAVPILSGVMAKLDDANTTGFYSKQVTVSAANGFEAGKSYSIYIEYAVVASAMGEVQHFEIEANSAAEVKAVADAVKLKTDLIPAGGPAAATDYTGARAAKLDNADVASSTLGTAANLALVKAKTDLIPAGGAADAAIWTAGVAAHIDADVSAVKAKTDLIPAGGPAAAADYTGARAAKLDNCDASVLAVKTKTDLIPAAGPADAADYTAARAAKLDNADASVAAVKAKTDLIPVGGPAAAADYTAARAVKIDHLDADITTRAATGAAMTLTVGERDAVAAALLGLADGIEVGYTVKQAIRLMAAVICGKASGGPGSSVFRNIGDTANRVTSTADSDGNRTTMTLAP